MSTKQALLSIGHSTLDTFIKIEDADMHCDIDGKSCKVCFSFGSKIPVNDVDYGIGGGATNVAVGTKHLGIDTSLYSIIGSDMKGKDIEKTLTEKGVGCAYLQMDDDKTDQAVVLSYNGERTIFTYNHPREYSVSRIPASSFSHIFLSSVGNSVSMLYEEVIDLKEENPDMVLFYNPGSRELSKAREDITRLMDHIDYLLANIDEGCTMLNEGLTRSEIEVGDLLNLLIEKGIKNVVLTDAEKGAYVASNNDVFHIPAIDATVVEMTGAGDAFASGFISAIMYGQDIETSAKWGAVNSSSVIQKLGAQNGLLSKDDIETKLTTLRASS